MSRKFTLAVLMLSQVAMAHAAATLKQRVEDKLVSLGARGYTVTELTDATLTKVVAEPMVEVRFRQYPIGFLPPAPLKVNNIFYDRAGSLELMTDIASLKAFFLARVKPVTTDDAAREAVTAWLLLSEELKQDGFFHFSIPAASLVVGHVGDKLLASGRAEVGPQMSNKGEIKAQLVFTRDGKLLSVDETSTVRAGIRPICQATKLLDPDPIVRRMAEQDLLVMGSAAKPYIDFIRPQLSSPLKAALDSLWGRILEEGR
jgi:hypothetical protein